jgi:ABC-type Fe3+-hydroxamate transport system substrate-binding protein
VGLIVLALARPAPVLPPFAQSRIVTDSEGIKVAVPQPLRALMTFGSSDFLETTHAPEMLLKAGSSHDRNFWFGSGLMARIYSQVVKNDALWDYPTDIEALIARDDHPTFFVGDGKLLRRLGLPVLAMVWYPPNGDEKVFQATRVANAAMGHEDQGEAFIAGYQQAYADLKQDLQPETLTDLPRVVGMGASGGDWSFLFISGMKEAKYDGQERAGVENATGPYENTGRQQDAERILAMNPDIVFLRADRKLKFPRLESVEDFLRDPRWQGLKAVQNNHVYNSPRSLTGSAEPLNGLDFRPIWARWTAEIAHPDRLQPKVRTLLREHFARAYGYALSDDEVDDLLRVYENKNTVGYARFMKNNVASNRQETPQ